MRDNRALLFLLSLLVGVGCGDSTSSGAGGVGGATGGAGGEPPLEVGETCTAFCAKVIGECGAFLFDEPRCQQGCQQNLNEEYEHAEPCGDAVDAVFLCVADLDCESVYDWRDRPPGTTACQQEIAVVDALIDAGICLPAT